jgi:hypothetical protein
MADTGGGVQNGTGEALPFSPTKQEALMGHLLTNEKFFLLAKNRIQPGWWATERLSTIWSMATDFADKYGRPPKIMELSEQQMTHVSAPDQAKLRTLMQLCTQRTGDIGLDVLKAELTDWFRCRIYVTAMKKSEALFNAAAKGGKATDSKKLQEAFDIMKGMTREIEAASFDGGHDEDMSDPTAPYERQLEDAKNAISYGLPAMNRLLLPEGEGKGSLLPGDMTVLLAPTNIGKTTTMVTIAGINIRAQKYVLMITHEGRINDIKMKIWQSMMGMSRQDMMNNIGKPTQGFMDELTIVRDLVNRYLVFMPLNKAGMAVEEVDAIIRRRQDQQIAKHGQGFDLIIDDYAAKLTTQQARGGHFALRQIHEVVYNYFSQIALEHNVHVVTAIQTNREGSKTNRKFGGKETQSRLLTMEDVMESWGPMTTATNVISINRDPTAQAKGVVTFYICKSRSSEVGWAVTCKSNYAAARSHWTDVPCTWYRGTSPMSEKVETLLEEFKGTEIPWQKVLEHENAA